MPRARPLAWLVIASGALAGCPDAQRPAAIDAAVAADAGTPFVPPLGGTWAPDRTAVHFRLAAPRATRVEVWIFAVPLGAPEVLRVELARDGQPWAAQVAAADLEAAGVTTVYYGYRVWGPNWTWDPAWQPGSAAGYIDRVDADGNRMNPNKLLLDPRAREISHDPTTPGSLDGRVYRTDDEWRVVDSGPAAPKGVVLPPEAWDGDLGARPAHPLRDDVIYEVHLRGLTAGDADAACAGTYAAAAGRAAYLAGLGVTAIELLPVQETWNDGNDVDPASAAGDNYWGYSTLAYFAPDRRYACDRSPGGPTREWREMVRAFHDHGVKVFIDVVYNHTAEGGGGNLLSWRGIDNAAYYELDAAGTGFASHNGVGANTAATSPVFRDLVIDSLAYWARDLGVDGFRFDLAPLLANGCTRGCFDWAPDAPGNALARAAAELPARPADGGAGVDLIAEPWAIGAGTYRVGQFPAGWSEWNDRFRDLVRQDVNLVGVVDVTPGWLADRLAGSPELFADDGRAPAASINYVVSHDGFTLHDVHACTGKRNDQPWPWGPSGGGTDANFAWDHGGDPARQRQAARTSLALLVLAAGVPMITGGDEMLRTQKCNNNPYNLDSPAIWLDWSGLADQEAFVTYTRRLLAFRRAHRALRPGRWHDGSTVSWHSAGGGTASGGYLDDPDHQFLAWRLTSALDDPARSIYVAYNGGTTVVEATLPAPSAGARWWRVADTGAWLEADGNFHAPGDEYRMNGDRYDLAARSLAIFVDR